MNLKCTNRVFIAGFMQACGSTPKMCAMKMEMEEEEENKMTRRLISMTGGLIRRWQGNG